MVGDTAPKRFRIAVDILAVLTAVALILSAWALYSRFSQTNQARADNRATWHAVICSIEQAVIANPDLAVVKKRSALRFYDGLLVENVHADGCNYTVRLPRR